MLLLFFYLFMALGISFVCSIMESVLLSVTPSYAAAYAERSPRIGRDRKSTRLNSSHYS